MQNSKFKNRGEKKGISYPLPFTSYSLSHGFTVLYSVLIASILLAIGISIFSTTLKDILFSSSGRESQYAFYAADTGIECALYWDKKHDIFATSTDSLQPSEARCDEENIAGAGNLEWPTDLTLDPLVTIFYLNKAAVSGKICAVVKVSKFTSGTTEIESRGYNTCELGNPRRIERGIKATY